MSDDSRATRLEVVETAKTPLEAQVIAAVLRGAGIPVYVGGSMLADEFAASQRLMGLGGVKVQVPHDLLEAAREALVESRQAGVALEAAMSEAGELEEEEVPPATGFDPAPPTRSWISYLGWPLAVILALWIATNRTSSDYGPFAFEATAEGYRYRWKANGARASEVVDRDGNGVWEVFHYFDREGVRTNTSYDADQDGLAERTVVYAPDGSVATTAFDADGDGRSERWQEHHAGGLRIWLDLDADGRFDRVEERDTADRLLRAWRVDPDAGFVLER